MTTTIPVDAVVVEKTYVGRVAFPVTVPERLAEWIRIPEDLQQHAAAMGLDAATVKFLLALLHGKWALAATVDLPTLAAQTGWNYAEMDAIIRDLLDKNYARLERRLELYRFWIALLHVKGIRFVPHG